VRGFTILQEHFGFTRNELVVITLLGSSFLVGLTARWIRGPADSSMLPAFDYARADSIFASRSVQGVTPAVAGRTTQRSPAPKLRPGDPPFDVNAATKGQLMRLPGIGPGLAEKIITYRANHGYLRSVDELTLVAGIGEKTLKRIRPFVIPRKPGPSPPQSQR